MLQRFPFSKLNFYFIYWLFYLLLFGFIQAGPTNDYQNAFGAELVGLPLKGLFVAIVCEWLMESLLVRKRIFQFLILYVPLLLVFAIFQRFVDNYIIIKYFLTYWRREPILHVPPLLYNVLKFQSVIAVPFCIKLFYFWAYEQNKTLVVAEEKSQAELTFLRNQFHPHFIFNVLNSLYSKILTNSPQSGDIVLRISSLLRFSIYELNTPLISLHKEIRYIEDYIELQKIRFGHDLQLSFEVEGNKLSSQIEPFLLMPFIENAFKHCIKEEGASWLKIHILIQNEWLQFKVENSLDRIAKNDSDNKGVEQDSGIGLAQVKSRLLHSYRTTHELRIVEKEDCFLVSLRLKLKNGPPQSELYYN